MAWLQKPHRARCDLILVYKIIDNLFAKYNITCQIQRELKTLTPRGWTEWYKRLAVSGKAVEIVFPCV